MPRIFISHSSKDNEAAAWLVEQLRENGFGNLFLDFDRDNGIFPGEGWEKRLYEEIKRSRVIVLLLSEHWLKSVWCFAEFAQSRALGKTVMPVVILPGGEEFPAKDLQTVDLVKNREEGMERLLARLGDLALIGPASFHLPEGRAPYPGLMSFDLDDAAVFFGRETEVTQTMERLEQLRVRGGARVLLLHGESGSGKSSLLKAGLLPRLGLRGEDWSRPTKQSPLEKNWIVLPSFRPGARPMDELRSVLLSALAGGNSREIEDLLEEPSVSTAGAVIEALRQHTGRFLATVLLAIDQLEELISLPEAEEQDRFLKVLEHLLNERHKSLVVATLRTSDLPQVAERLGPDLSREEFLIGSFPLTSLPEIVRGPAEVARIVVEEKLVDAIKQDGVSSDTLPLVAFLLRRLYDLHGSNHHLTLAEYVSMGDSRSGLSTLETCIRDAADEALKHSEAQRAELEALREVFVSWLVRPSEGNSYVRHTLPPTEVPKEAARLCNALERVRLLIRRDDGGLEVAHESLFRVWPRLAKWLEDEREFIQGHARIEADLTIWKRAAPEQRERVLLHGLFLDRAEDWLQRHPKRFSKDEAALIEASKEAKRRNELARQAAESAKIESDRQRLEALERDRISRRRSIVILIVGLVVSLAVASYAWIQRGEAKTFAGKAGTEANNAKQAANDAEFQAKAADRNAYNAAIIAAAAKLDQGQVGAAMQLLDATKKGSRGWEWGYYSARCDDSTLCLRGHTGPVVSAEFSPDGREVLTASSDGSVRLWNAETGEPIRQMDGGYQGPVMHAKFTQKGRKLLIVKDMNSSGLWDAGSGKLLHIFDKPSVTIAALDAQGKRAATAGIDGTAEIWDLESGEKQNDLGGSIFLRGTGTPESLFSAGFNSDGSRLFTRSVLGVKVWNTEDGKQVRQFYYPDALTSAASFKPDGRLALATSPKAVGGSSSLVEALLKGDYPGSIRLVDVESGVDLYQIAQTTGPIHFMEFTRNGEHLLCAGDYRRYPSDPDITIRDSATGWVIARADPRPRAILQCRFSPDESNFAVSCRMGEAAIYDSTNGKLIRPLYGHTPDQNVNSVAYRPDGKALVTASDDGTARIWDLEPSRPRQLIASGRILELREASGELQWIEAGEDNTVILRREGDAGKGVHLIGHSGMIMSAATSADGQQVITGSADRSAILWDVRTAKKIWKIEDENYPFMRCIFSPDRKLVILINEAKKARILDASTSKHFFPSDWFSKPIISAAFSPDGSMLALAPPYGEGYICATTKGFRIANWGAVDASAVQMTFNHDGTRLLTALLNNTITIHNPIDGKPTGIIRGPEGLCLSSAFTKDGERMLTGSSDGTARVWDLLTGHELVKLTGVNSNSEIRLVGFSADDTRIFACEGDRTIVVWDSLSTSKRAEERNKR